MAKRERQNELKIYLNNDEQYILEQKFKISGMKSKSSFIRHLNFTDMSMTWTTNTCGNTTQSSPVSATI